MNDQLQDILLNADDPIWKLSGTERDNEAARRGLPGWWWPSFDDKPFSARVDPCNCGRMFDWAEGGLLEAVKPGFGIRAQCMPVRDEDGSQIDTVAWDPGAPYSWWVRRGEEIAWLGLDYAAFRADSLNDRRSVTIFETPEQWVTAGRRGLVVLNWRLSRYDFLVLEAFDTVRCVSTALGERLATAHRQASKPAFRCIVADATAERAA